MNFEEYKKSLTAPSPPKEISEYLRSLWYDAKGDWNKAHLTIQDVENKNAAMVHAYLHRKEGDKGNADYWYQQAGKKRPAISLEREWEELVKKFI